MPRGPLANAINVFNDEVEGPIVKGLGLILIENHRF